MKEKTMTSRERVLACLEGEPTDCLPLMPITMMFAADRLGVKYRDYAADYRVLVEGQLKTAEIARTTHPAGTRRQDPHQLEWPDDTRYGNRCASS